MVSEKLVIANVISTRRGLSSPRAPSPLPGQHPPKNTSNTEKQVTKKPSPHGNTRTKPAVIFPRSRFPKRMGAGFCFSLFSLFVLFILNGSPSSLLPNYSGTTYSFGNAPPPPSDLRVRHFLFEKTARCYLVDTFSSALLVYGKPSLLLLWAPPLANGSIDATSRTKKKRYKSKAADSRTRAQESKKVLRYEQCPS